MDNPIMKRIQLIYKYNPQFGILHKLVVKYIQAYQLEPGLYWTNITSSGNC